MSKRGGFTWIEAVVIIGILAILAAILFPVFFGKARESVRSPDAACQSNLKQISLAIKLYLQDFDETHPILVVNHVSQSVYPFSKPYGWADAIEPYIKSTQVFQCSREPHPPNAKADAVQSNFTDYWFNRRMAGVQEKNLAEVSRTIMLGDGNDGTDATNARYAIPRLPAKWLTDKSSPAYRHHADGMNFAFADGHVKWFKADNLSQTIGDNPKPPKISFSPR